MRLITGRVVNGKVEVPPEIEEGSSVAVLAPEDDSVVLTPAEEEALSESIRHIEAGESVDGWELLEEIRRG